MPVVAGFREGLPVREEVLTPFWSLEPLVPLYPAVPFPASPAAVPGGWPPELAGAGIVAVRVADLACPLRRPLREGDRSALTAAGAGTIRTGDLVVFLKPVAVAAAVVRRDGRVQAGGHPAGHARLGIIEQQLDEMTGTPGVIDMVAAEAVPHGKVKGTALRCMTMAAAVRAVLLMTLMAEAGGRGGPAGAVRRPGAAALARAVRRADGHGARHVAGRGRPGAAAAAAGHGPGRVARRARGARLPRHRGR